MKYHIFLLLFYLAARSSGKLMAQEAETNVHRVQVSSSSIIIHGKTNVNSFDCSLHRYGEGHQVEVKNVWTNGKLDFEGLQLAYQIGEFDCGIKAMNADFQDLMKADEEPLLWLQLNSIQLHPNNHSFEELDVVAEIEIIISGINKTIIARDCIVYNHSEAHLTLSGNKDMQLSDFEMEPPEKFFGMVRVKNEITIAFEIEMIVSAI